MDATFRIRGSGAGRRVVVAMSGGVDSSVTAALLTEADFENVGVLGITPVQPTSTAGPVVSRRSSVTAPAS